MTTKTERFEARFDPDLMDRIDVWREKRPERPARSEAVRQLIERGLTRDQSVPASDRLVLSLLSGIADKIGVDTEIDRDLLMSSIVGGHFWALEWEYQGLLHEHVDDRSNVTEVVDILDMWKFIEAGWAALSEAERKRVKEENESVQPVFPGFDGNNESEHLSIARHMIDKMGRFGSFADRNLNAHHPTLGWYRDMLERFEPVRAKLIGRDMSKDELELVIARNT